MPQPLAPAAAVASGGSSTTPIWVGSPFNGRWPGSPLPADARPDKHSPVFGVPGRGFKHNVAMDLYAPAGTPARLYAAPKNGSHASVITARVLDVRPTCSSGDLSNGGRTVIVGLFDRGVRVGDVAFGHLNVGDLNGDGRINSSDISYRGTIARWGGTLGTVGKYAKNSCWNVSTTAGHHLHIELANEKNYACARSLGNHAAIVHGILGLAKVQDIQQEGTW